MDEKRMIEAALAFFTQHPGAKMRSLYENGPAESYEQARALVRSLARQALIQTTQDAYGRPTGHWYPTSADDREEILRARAYKRSRARA